MKADQIFLIKKMLIGLNMLLRLAVYPRKFCCRITRLQYLHFVHNNNQSTAIKTK